MIINYFLDGYESLNCLGILEARQTIMYFVKKKKKRGLYVNNSTNDTKTLCDLSLFVMLNTCDNEVDLGINTAKSRLKEGSMSHI